VGDHVAHLGRHLLGLAGAQPLRAAQAGALVSDRAGARTDDDEAAHAVWRGECRFQRHPASE
jgi:hypothetical protein